MIYFIIIEAFYIVQVFLNEKNTIEDLANFKYNDINSYYRVLGVIEDIIHVTTAFESKLFLEGFIHNHIR